MLKRILFLVVLLVVGIAGWILLGPKRGESQVVAQSFLFTWPADDGNDPASGLASSIELRWSRNAIVGTDTLSWWNAATRWTGSYPSPKVVGTADSVIVTGLPNSTQIYAVMKACDEVPNCSGFSNVAAGRTKDFVTPAPPGNVRFGWLLRSILPREAVAGELVEPGRIRDLRFAPAAAPVA